MVKKIKKFKIVNLDVTLIADKPRLVKHKPAMKASLKKIFGVAVNIKIKSKEGLNILGGSNAVSCVVAAMLKGK